MDTNLVSEALTNVTVVFTAALDMITSNPLAMVYVGLGLAGAGIALFRQLVPRSH